MNFKPLLKNITSHALSKTGFFNFLGSSLLKNKAFILMYHRVIPSPATEPSFVQPGMYVSTKTFRNHASLLKKNFRVLSLGELLNNLKRGKDITKCCAITFDDGWQDTFSQAFPVLEDYGLPATVFMTTGFIDTGRMFWPEELTFFLQQNLDSLFKKKHPVLLKLFSEVVTNRENTNYLDNAIQALKTWTPRERETLMLHLRASLNTASKPKRLMMNWKEAQQMLNSGLIDFGAHSVNHMILDQVPLQEAELEMSQSIKSLRDNLDISPIFFAYPNGNFNHEIKTLLKKNNIKGAVTTQRGWLDFNTDMLAIPRVAIHEDVGKTPSRFFARIYLNF